MRVVGALLLGLFVATGCGKKTGEKKPDVDLEPVRAKFADYLKWSDDLLAPQEHWVSDTCDDVLFTGLRGLYDDAVDLTKGLKSPGEWTRRRLSSGDCFELKNPDGNPLSASRTSRDMITGVAMWALHRDRKQLACDIVDYTEHHSGRLGDGDFLRSDVRPPLYVTLLKICGRKVPLDVPVTVGGELGFERHIAAWHVIARADVEGGLSAEPYHAWIKANAENQPQNPLHQWMRAAYVTGEFQPVVDSLMDERYWPRDHLPTSANFCDPFVIQRDAGADWEACKDPATKQWSGSDWLAVAYLLLR